MSARVENRSHLPQAAVRSIVRRVLGEFEANYTWVTVKVFITDHWHHHGHFYARRRFEEDAFDVTIIARVPMEYDGTGHDRKLRGGPPPIDPQDWRESLVCIVAHEATHVRQFLAGPKTEGHWRMVKGKRRFVNGRVFSEVDAEWAEYRALKRWRERRNR